MLKCKVAGFARARKTNSFATNENVKSSCRGVAKEYERSNVMYISDGNVKLLPIINTMTNF